MMVDTSDTDVLHNPKPVQLGSIHSGIWVRKEHGIPDPGRLSPIGMEHSGNRVDCRVFSGGSNQLQGGCI